MTPQQFRALLLVTYVHDGGYDQESSSFWSKNSDKESDSLLVKILKIFVNEPGDSLYRYCTYSRYAKGWFIILWCFVNDCKLATILLAHSL